MKFTYLALFNCLATALLAYGNEPSDSQALGGIGKGAAITLSKEILVPANQEWVDLPTRSYWGPKTRIPIGYGMYFEEWIQYTHTCRLYLQDQSVDRRVLPAGTEILLNGEYTEEEQDPQSHVIVQGLMVSSPQSVRAFACGGYSERYRSFLGERTQRLSGPHGPVLLTIGDFRNLMSGIGTLVLSAPVPISLTFSQSGF